MITPPDTSTWETVLLKSVLSDLKSGKRPHGGVRGIENGVLSIGGEHIGEDGVVNLTTPRWIPTAFAGTIRNARVQPQDILIVKDGATTGKVAIADERFATQEAYVNEHVFLCRVNRERILPRLLFHFLRSEGGKSRILEDFRGAAQGGISRAFADKVQIRLPPFVLQSRLLSKIERTTNDISTIRGELRRVELLMAKYRLRIVSSIMQRELASIGSASQPLRDLVDDRGIPYGIVQTGRQFDGGIPTVRGGDIKQFAISKGELKRVDPAIAVRYTRTRLRGGEVLLSIRGTVGNSAVAGEELTGCNISREVAMIPLNGNVFAPYVAYFLATDEAQAFLTGHTKGVAQRGINLADLRNLPIPVPALARQQDIAAQVETALSTAFSLLSESRRASVLVDRLEQSILRTAFPTEPQIG